MGKTFRVGTRKSPLALKQAEEIIKGLKAYSGHTGGFSCDIEFDIVAIETYGDNDKYTPISEMEGTDFFTREIDEALLEGGIDFAVHSAKDLPRNLIDGLEVAGMTRSIDPYDCLVSRFSLKLDELPYGARIGTSSQRRKIQLKKYRNDFQIVDIRGNIEERLRLLDNHGSRNLDSIVIAAAGLVRLGLEKRILERIPLEILRPHPLQGSLAVVVRKGRPDLVKFLEKLEGVQV